MSKQRDITALQIFNAVTYLSIHNITYYPLHISYTHNQGRQRLNLPLTVTTKTKTKRLYSGLGHDFDRLSGGLPFLFYSSALIKAHTLFSVSTSLSLYDIMKLNP